MPLIMAKDYDLIHWRMYMSSGLNGLSLLHLALFLPLEVQQYVTNQFC